MKKLTPAAKIAIVLELIKSSQPCVCRCGHEHETGPGPLDGIPKDQVIKILNSGEK